MENDRMDAVRARADEEVKAIRQASPEAMIAAYEEAVRKVESLERELKTLQNNSDIFEREIPEYQAELKRLGNPFAWPAYIRDWEKKQYSPPSTERKSIRSFHDKLEKERKKAFTRSVLSGERKRELLENIEYNRTKIEKCASDRKETEAQLVQAQAAVPEKPAMQPPPDKRETTYKCAEVYLQAGLYTPALYEFWKIRGYRDVNRIIATTAGFTAGGMTRLSADECIKGLVVDFGRYMQYSEISEEEVRGEHDRHGLKEVDFTRGLEPIRWFVAANDGELATLVSLNVLDAMPYHSDRETWKNVRWDTCTLRRWLNDDFLTIAFNEAEQAKLATVTVTTDDNPNASPYERKTTDQGSDTQDRVFLLSVKEAERYLGTGAGACQATEYAAAVFDAKYLGHLRHFIERDGELIRRPCEWWLRTCAKSGAALDSTNIGGIRTPSNVSVDLYRGVRPVIVLRLSELEQGQ